MKYRLLLLMSLVSISLMTISCSLFGGDDEGEGGIDQIRFNIETELIAGQTMRVSMGEGSSQFKIKEMSIDGMKLTNLNEVMGSSEHRYAIPADLQGAYKLMAKVQSYNDKDEPVTMEAGTVVIHKFLGDVYPGVAYRVDLSDAHTVLCATSRIEPTDNEQFDRENNQTFKFAAGQAPVQAKFYDALGTEVPATFTSIKDISQDLFFATMCNARPRDPDNGYAGEGMFFDSNNFTCEVRMDHYSERPVVVSKKTGIIAVLEQGDENTNGHISADSEFQSMGPGVICFGGSSYGSEFTKGKLHTFDASFILEVSEKQDQLDESFQYVASIKQLEGQENLDILNGQTAHWLALPPGKVLFNRERMLSGNLSSVQFPNDVHTLFGVYSTNDFYGIKSGQILATNGLSITNPQDEVSIVDIYQFPDSTLVRSRITHHKVGETMNHYSFKKGSRYLLYKEEIKETMVDYEVYSTFSPLYPCTSNYEYVCVNNDYNALYRRPIKAIYSRGEEQVIFKNAPTMGLMGSASKNAITFIDRGENFEPSPECINRIIEIGPQGNIMQAIALDKGLFVTGLCRFKD